MVKKLTKGSNKMLFGICSGIGEYFEIDPTLVRVGFVLFGVLGAGILVYLIMAIIVPQKD
ncbi:MAG TPA: PspC domain-containing protein [Bacteroidales bacterium]|nr:PspC domain-containing protein [Bacteroidales bacterium]